MNKARQPAANTRRTPDIEGVAGPSAVPVIGNAEPLRRQPEQFAAGATDFIANIFDAGAGEGVGDGDGDGAQRTYAALRDLVGKV